MNELDPIHIAVIMDGNGRWSANKGMSRYQGHKEGAYRARCIIDSCLKLGIKYLTLYTFSTENWNREKDEIDYIMQLIDSYLTKERILDLSSRSIKINIIGNTNKCSKAIQENIDKYVLNEKYNNPNHIKLTLNVALNYGSKAEIVNAMQKINDMNITNTAIDAELIESKLYTNGMPPPDLLIRTGGEKRLSNFLLWQIAYTELYFSDIMWPDFTEEHLLEAINEYRRRERRYGRSKAPFDAKKSEK